MSTYYDDYRNIYYNPDDVEEQPGDNQNWKMIQKGFSQVSNHVGQRNHCAFYNKTALTVSGKSFFKVENTYTGAALLALLKKGSYTFRMLAITDDDNIFPVSDPYIITQGTTVPEYYNFSGCTSALDESAESVTLGIWFYNNNEDDISLDIAGVAARINIFANV